MQSQQFPDIKERITDLLRNKKTQLPTLPVVVQNIIRISRDDSTSASDLAAFINNDQAIANKVLRLANSPYYGRSGRVDSILRAITIIGFDEIVSIAIGIGVFPSLKASGFGQLFNVRQLWLHAIGSCFAARAIAEHLNGGRGGKAQSGNGEQKSIFLTALFHDMGKVLFLIYFPKEYREVLEKSAAEQLPLQQVEELLLGVDHGQLAARIMENWNFPDTIILPVRYHHAPEKCPPDQRLDARIVWAANALVRVLKIGASANPSPYGAGPLLELLGSRDEVANILERLKKQIPEMETFLQLMQ